MADPALRPGAPAVGWVYAGLSKEIDPANDVSAPMPLASPSTRVQETLAALGRDHSLESERFRLLFDQADRIRMSVYGLTRLHSEQKPKELRQGDAKDLDKYIDRLLGMSSKLLGAVAQCLSSGECLKEEPVLIGGLRKLIEEAHSRELDPGNALLAEVASAVDVLAGQLRAVVELANHAIPSGLEEVARREAALPWRFQIRSWFGALRANLDLRSAFCRHGIRLAVCVAIGDAIGRAISWERSYWLPMTVAVVLKPDFTTTFSRGVLRLAGTFAGLLAATVLYHIFPESALTQLILVGVFTFMMRSIGPANYGVFSIAVSGLIVFLIAAIGVPPAQAVRLRGLNTLAGGILALTAYALWPTWERTQISEVMAEMLDACRLYFHVVVQRFGRDDATLVSDLDKTRGAWRRARSNAEASVDRISAEPKITAEKLSCLTSMLASSHALVNAVMGLEAGLVNSGKHTRPHAFEIFANHVELTLYFLSAALRGSPGAAQTFPKLRQDYRRMVEARSDFLPTDEFVLLETDRIATSLNTLREQTARCVGLGP